MLPKPVPATFGGFAARLVELSLVGCQIEHTDRVTPKSRLPLRFKWRGTLMRVEATIMRSEMRSVGGKPAYVSGLEFCSSIEESPRVIREIMEFLKPAVAAPAPAEPAPLSMAPPPFIAVDDEPELLDAPYLQFTFGRGQWTKLYVDSPQQPKEGFTIVAPSNDGEVDVLCRAYEKAGADKRRAMRASFEQALTQKRGR